MRIKTTRAAVLAGAALCGSAAQAEKRDFSACDGLRAPGEKNAGMAGPASDSTFALLPSLRMPNAPNPTITACTNALADPRLLPTATLRRAHLLRARALAKLQADDADGAIVDLDAANVAAGPLAQDPLYARSMGVSVTLARAAALQVKGDRASARRLATEAAAARPYSIAIQSMAAMIRQRARDAEQASEAPFAAMLPLNPQAYELQFCADLEAGRFAQAAAAFPRLKQNFPKPGLISPEFLGASTPARTLVASLLNAGGASYAYAATGDVAHAKALLAETGAKLDDALVPEVDKKGVQLPVSPLAQPLREAWSRAKLMTEARIAIAEGRPLDAMKPLVGTGIPVSASGVELLTALKAALPEAQRALAPDPATLQARLIAQRKAEQLDVAALRKAMPLPETTSNLADYEGAGSRFLATFFGGAGASNDGFRSKTDEATGVTTVEFVGQSSSVPAVEELTLLRAADLARQAGKHGLLIVARRDYARTMTVTRGYSAIPISSTPAGYKTELDVRFVDPAALPADLAAERGRVLDADQVYAALAPIYIRPAPVKTAAR